MSKIWGRFSVVAYDAAGQRLWERRFHNLWTTQGRNDLLNQYFGGTAVVTVYLGLISSVSFSALAAGDTAAQIGGTNGWTEYTGYSNSTRPTLTLAAASGGSRAASAASVFNINTAGTVKGVFVITDNTIGGTAGVLLAEGFFDQGDSSVSSPTTLQCAYTLGL